MIILFVSFVLWVTISLFTLFLLEHALRKSPDIIAFIIKLAAFIFLFLLLVVVISISAKSVWIDINALAKFGESLVR